MRNWLAIWIVGLLVAAEARGEEVASQSWQLTPEVVLHSSKSVPESEQPQHEPVWHFSQTVAGTGPIETRQFRANAFHPLPEFREGLLGAPLNGWIHEGGTSAPFVAVASEPYHNTNDLPIDAGDVILAPGAEHAVVVGWQSPVFGKGSLDLELQHLQGCCGINSQVNWRLQWVAGPESSQAGERTLAGGHLDFNPANEGKIHFILPDLQFAAGDMIYLVVDAHADGSGTPHHGDGCRLKMSVSVENPRRPTAPTFQQDILPLLTARCLHCHGAETQESGLDLRTVESLFRGGESGGPVVAGHPSQSYLYHLVSQGEMPPDEEERLSPNEVKVFERWIRLQRKGELAGLSSPTFVKPEDREQWAFRLPRRGRLPRAGSARSRNPIDLFLFRKLQEQELDFSEPAHRTAQLRRLYLDLIGLPPTPVELEEFVHNDSPDAYERVVDQLLASPRYGERWGRHWMDAVGYVDNRLYDGDLATIFPHEGIWRYRDFIIGSLNRDKPWNTFLEEQLAGDSMVDWQAQHSFDEQTRERLAATAFLRNVEDHTSEAQYGIGKRYEVLFDTVEMVSGSLLGLTLNCSRCHNHKFDPISQRDYYQFMAYFESGYNVHQWRKPTDRWLPDVGPGRRAEIEAANAKLQAEITRLQKDKKQADQQKDESRQLELSQQIAGLEAQKQSFGRFPVLLDRPRREISRVLRRGMHEHPGVPVVPAPPEILVPSNWQASSLNSQTPRLQLAEWIASPQNPLTARVFVNRVWHHHFGRGIVATLGNFGLTGEPPTHPELLDWLAVEFMESGWSLKRLHRLMVTSHAYRQSSQRTDRAEAEQIDPDNQLLWRQNLRRLESEVIRDLVLAVSGQLNEHAGGPAVSITAPSDGLSVVDPTPDQSQNRRSVYLFHRRVYPLKFMELFDSPIMPINCLRREHTTSVLQSFALLNSEFIIDHAKKTAHIMRAADESLDGQLRHLYTSLLGRSITPEELHQNRTFLQQQSEDYQEHGQSGDDAQRLAFADLCHILMCSNEFLYVE